MKTEVIAISGKSGCGNSTVSRIVAETLNFTLVNYTLRNMAEEMGIPFRNLLVLTEKDYSYDRSLDKKQHDLAIRGKCVLGSRLAIWIMKDESFTVYLEASPATRFSRIAAREGGSLEEVIAFNSERDAKDHKRYLEIYAIDNDEYSFADLIVKTEDKNPHQIANIIIAAWENFLDKGNI